MVDRISQLPDDVILKILLFLPSMKHVMATMLLSKRWRFIWMMVPKLVYDYTYHDIRYGRSWRLSYTSFSQFVDRSLLRHETPAIETMHFKLGEVCGSGDIRVWIREAYKRRVPELIIETDLSYPPLTLPRSLYTCCSMLTTLKLSNAALVDDDETSPISFPSLKRLSLVSMEFPSLSFSRKLLRGCPVLEDLVMEHYPLMSINVPSLKSLVLRSSKPVNRDTNYIIFNSNLKDMKRDANDIANTFEIDTPSLEYLDIVDHHSWFCVIENMPKLETANVDVTYRSPGNTLGSLTSVKRLSLCLSTSKNAAYPVGSVFQSLVHLRLCTCDKEWLNLLMRLLGDSPNLRALKLEKCHRYQKVRPYWSEPSPVPECILRRLETLEWVGYEGLARDYEKEVAFFILRNAHSLKKATIISSKDIHHHRKLEMIKELSSCPRVSPTCELLFS